MIASRSGAKLIRVKVVVMNIERITFWMGTWHPRKASSIVWSGSVHRRWFIAVNAAVIATSIYCSGLSMTAGASTKQIVTDHCASIYGELGSAVAFT